MGNKMLETRSEYTAVPEHFYHLTHISTPQVRAIANKLQFPHSCLDTSLPALLRTAWRENEQSPCHHISVLCKHR